MAASTQTIELNVKGMDCADCALHVEHAVSALPGVARAQVFLMTEKGIVEFDPARAGRRRPVAPRRGRVSQLVAAVAAVGASGPPGVYLCNVLGGPVATPVQLGRAASL